MAIEQHAKALLENKFFLLVKAELEQEYFEIWRASTTTEERDEVHSKLCGITDFMSLVEAQAAEYDMESKTNDD